MRIIIAFLLFTLLSFTIPTLAVAQQLQEIPKPEFVKAKVEKIFKEGERTIVGFKTYYQTVSVLILEGKDQGKTLRIESGQQTTLSPSQIVKEGQIIILTRIINNGKMQYQVYDTYRINSLIYLTLLFALVVIIIARWKGLGSLVGLAISLAIIVYYIVPQILAGQDPLKISIYGSLAILFLTTYLAHGVSRQTTIALLSTFIALFLTAWFSSLFAEIASLTGFSEETSILQFGAVSTINFKGLLLGGIIIGTLGALNDITTTQAAAVLELSKTDVKLSFSNLFNKGFAIGREHVVSMVNTLVLAYAGSSLALFLFIVLNPQKLPIWVIINSEDLSNEIIRTLAGSMGLILVVPVVTLLAAFVCSYEFKTWIKKHSPFVYSPK